MLSANAGFLFAFLAGYYLTYHSTPYIGIAISAIYLVTFVYFPETPIFLLRHKKDEVNIRIIVKKLCEFSVETIGTTKSTIYLFHHFILQLAEKSFRFYRNISADGAMSENISKEWNDLRARVEEMMQTEKKISKFECRELCKFLLVLTLK